MVLVGVSLGAQICANYVSKVSKAEAECDGAIAIGGSFCSDFVFDERGAYARIWEPLLATILKRIRVIKRDVKGFLFELILPIVIIILAMLLMTVSFIRDSPNQDLNYDLYYEN